MGLLLLDNFDIAQAKPLDSRTVVSTFSNLNNIINKYNGLTCYVNDEQKLYVYNADGTWKNIGSENTNNLESLNFSSSVLIDPTYNGKILYYNGANSTNAIWANNSTNYPANFNVSIIQQGIGSVTINSFPGGSINTVNRLNAKTTAGQYAVISILKMGDSNNFILYGDLI
jgi:hypothetical protein